MEEIENVLCLEVRSLALHAHPPRRCVLVRGWCGDGWPISSRFFPVEVSVFFPCHVEHRYWKVVFGLLVHGSVNRLHCLFVLISCGGSRVCCSDSRGIAIYDELPSVVRYGES